ncbi:hypothetical protein Cni_G12950 [Canna indica]|uniref:DUF6821 domain-containing protein n=1 Tax=Canna indica TaxID=4628 RepID=A0AAQ3QB34_9LILI|nr:hypothetical protein Cni_G12950 [Canna indica]
MQKSCLKMELDDWEFIPDSNSFLDFSHDTKNNLLLAELIVDMDYFMPSEEEHNSIFPKQALPPPVPHPTPENKNGKPDESLDREFKDGGVVPPPPPPPPVILLNHHQDVVSQVFFKKLKENEIAERKVESSLSSWSNARGAIVSHAEQAHFNEDEEAAHDNLALENSPSEEEEMEVEDKACGFYAWRLRLAGIGAFCSMGAAVTAATFCIMIFGGGGGGGRLQQKQRIQFSICADDRVVFSSIAKEFNRMKEMASRLNQAVPGVRGSAAMRSAHISFGGYYASA